MSKKEYIIGFIIVFLVCLSVYLYTVAPTLSFWDCGEYIACAHILGVPHPPGGPLHILIRKVFTLIPFGKEIGFRANILSVLCGALGAALIYFFVVKVIGKWRRPSSMGDKAIIHISGFMASMICAFSFTYWWNSMESEAYGLSTFILLFCLFLALFVDEVKQYKKLLVLIIYILALSVGIHLLPLLAGIGIIAFILIKNFEEIKDRELVNFAVLLVPFFFLCIGVPLPAVIFVAICAFGYIIYERKKLYKDNKFIILTLCLVLIGFTTFSYSIIRARANPGINEVAPTNIHRLWDCFTRKQYGPGTFANPFQRKTCIETGYSFPRGVYEQVKFFGRYFIWQYTPFPRESAWEGAKLSSFTRFGSTGVTLIFIGLGLFGMYSNFRKHNRTFWLFFITFFLAGIMLAIYQDFKFSPSDPNPLHNPDEVRERHYFFGPAFALFPYFCGIGIFELLSKIKRNFRLVVSCICIPISLVPLFSNFYSHANRHNLWIPDDYGYNMLSSCEPGSCVFTNGDNDTFPLWFAQEVKRTNYSVIIANLSLLNTEWYIKQLKRKGAPISFTDYEIDNLTPYPVIKDGKIQRDKILLVKDFGVRDIIATNGGFEFEDKVFFPIKRQTLPKEYQRLFPKDMTVIHPNYYTRRLPKKYWIRLPEEYFLPAQDFTDLVVKNYTGKVPIYFAVTVSRDNTKGFEKYLRMEALVRRIAPENPGFDIERSDSLLNKVYRYRSIFDERVYKDKTTKKLLSNYAAGYFALGMSLERVGDTKRAIEAFEQGKKFRTGSDFPFAYHLSRMYEKVGELSKAENCLKEVAKEDNMTAGYLLGNLYIKRNDFASAESIFNKVISADKNAPNGYAGLIELYSLKGDSILLREILGKCMMDPNLVGKIFGLYNSEGKKDLARFVLDTWVKHHPQDTVAKKMLKGI